VNKSDILYRVTDYSLDMFLCACAKAAFWKTYLCDNMWCKAILNPVISIGIFFVNSHHGILYRFKSSPGSPSPK
jgi:hypothetical protein